jgi:hypothetical protein
MPKDAGEKLPSADSPDQHFPTGKSLIQRPVNRSSRRQNEISIQFLRLFIRTLLHGKQNFDPISPTGRSAKQNAKAGVDRHRHQYSRPPAHSRTRPSDRSNSCGSDNQPGSRLLINHPILDDPNVDKSLASKQRTGYE